MTTTYKGVVFDLDGTLINSVEEIAHVTNTVLKEAGLPTHPSDAYKYFAGNGAQILLERATPAEVVADAKRFEPLYQRMLTVYDELSGTLAKPYDGINALLAALSKKGVKLHVLSNKPHEATLECVNTLLPGHSFDLIYGARDGVPKKPHPQGAMDILKETAIAPSEMLYLGDTAVDMEAACRARMVAVVVLWGFRERDELEKSGASHIIGSPLELLNLL